MTKFVRMVPMAKTGKVNSRVFPIATRLNSLIPLWQLPWNLLPLHMVCTPRENYIGIEANDTKMTWMSLPSRDNICSVRRAGKFDLSRAANIFLCLIVLLSFLDSVPFRCGRTSTPVASTSILNFRIGGRNIS